MHFEHIHLPFPAYPLPVLHRTLRPYKSTFFVYVLEQQQPPPVLSLSRVVCVCIGVG